MKQTGNKISSPVGAMQKRRIVTVLAATGVVVLLALVAVFIWGNRDEQKLALKVGDREVTQADFDKYVKIGKKSDMDRQQVRELVIEYEKNKIMVDKYKIAMPEEYVEALTDSMDIMANGYDTGTSQDLSNEEALQKAVDEYKVGGGADEQILSYGEQSGVTDNVVPSQPEPLSGELADMSQYNSVFNLRVAQSGQSGQGLFIYEFAAARMGDDKALADVKKVAEEYRKNLVSGTWSSSETLLKAKEFNADNGRNGNSQVSFLSEAEEGDYNDPAQNTFSATFLQDQVKKYPKGISKLIETDTNSVFFMNVVFNQKKKDNIQAKVVDAKESTRVVIYDKQ